MNHRSLILVLGLPAVAFACATTGTGDDVVRDTHGDDGRGTHRVGRDSH